MFPFWLGATAFLAAIFSLLFILGDSHMSLRAERFFTKVAVVGIFVGMITVALGSYVDIHS